MCWFSHQRSRVPEDHSRPNRTHAAVNVHCCHPRWPNNGLVGCCMQRTACSVRIALLCIVNGDDSAVFHFLSRWHWPLTLIFELGRDFCTMHLTAKFHHPTFSRLEVIMRTNKLTNTQTQLKTSISLRYATPVGKYDMIIAHCWLSSLYSP